MAVYTKINQGDISSLLRQYDIGEIVDFKEVVEGIDNSNFIIRTTAGKFILTIFESRIKSQDLPFFINLKLHLAQKGICCPYPILDRRGSVITDFKGKKTVIVTFLNGRPIAQIDRNACFEIGRTLAKLHLAAADFSMSRKNDLGVAGFRDLLLKFIDLLDSYQIGLRQEILTNLEFLESAWSHDLPKAASHLDLFPDNVFFDDSGKVSGVIDFYFAANEAMILDFAIAANAWGNVDDLLAGYEDVRKFSSEEKKFLKIALAVASMRFLLTRLHDMFFTPKNSLVRIKDPQEYLLKFRHFRSQI
jgi:homoserine kinase type II